MITKEIIEKATAHHKSFTYVSKYLERKSMLTSAISINA